MPKKVDFSKRPACPECKAKRTWDNGSRWICSVCGKQWGKIKRPRRSKEFKDRPQCPTCGAFRSTPHRGNFGWLCLACGAVFVHLPEEI